jgi:molecular chaperone GrpE
MQSSRASDSRAGEPSTGEAREGRPGAPSDGERAPVSDRGGAGGPAPDLQAELAAMEDRYKRALADLDNYRKRSARELERRVDESREAVIRDWLEAVDSVERALRMDPDGPAAEGLRAVLEQMEAILSRQGVDRIGAAGEPFDPQRFEAVGVRDTSEAPDRTVIEVVRSGFGADGRVLRPAQVIVADSHRHDAG